MFGWGPALPRPGPSLAYIATFISKLRSRSPSDAACRCYTARPLALASIHHHLFPLSRDCSRLGYPPPLSLQLQTMAEEGSDSASDLIHEAAVAVRPVGAVLRFPPRTCVDHVDHMQVFAYVCHVSLHHHHHHVIVSD